MYGKLFESIYDGTLVEDWRALITFQQMIILCDSDGVLDMTAGALSRRTGIPLEHIKHGINVLESPDDESRSPAEEGKRIIRLNEHRDWGWHIVNHKHYRDLRTADDRREYMRNYMREKRKKDKLTNVNESSQLTKLANTDTDTDTDTDTPKRKGTKKFNPPSHAEVQMYCQEKGYQVDAESFCDFYISKDWMIGKNKMKDWKAAVRTWVKRQEKNHGQTDTRSRAKKHQDKLREIAERDIDENGPTPFLD